ncbi:MAG: cbb3-type cytochrome oxidase assembly protein CcoS [Rhodospirillaceae bacterium]
MSELVLLMCAALGLGLLGLAAFLWALKSGQFDDLDGAAYRILFDPEPEAIKQKDTPEAIKQKDTPEANQPGEKPPCPKP